MIESPDFQTKRMLLNDGAGYMPVLGFGTLIPGAAATRSTTRDALEAGFRHFDCAERYRNEREVGGALQAGLATGGIAREDIFVTTKLWNSNHRPERVKPAFEASLDRLGMNYLDLYLIHTPFAFQPGDEQDPRDENGNIIYDRGVTLLETWGAMESLVGGRKCRAIGLSDISLNELLPLYESARLKPAVVQVEAHPYLPEAELLEFRKKNGVIFLAFAPLGHGIKPGPLEDPVISAIALVGKTPAQVLLAWAVQRGTALLTTPRTAARARDLPLCVREFLMMKAQARRFPFAAFDVSAERNSGRIVETEAYPVGDSAGHAFRGETRGNASLFPERGHAHVYVSYDSSFMLNLTSEAVGVGAGVLLRALEPLEGIVRMQRYRGGTGLLDLARGPGRLAQGMQIDFRQDGLDLCATGPLWLATGGRKTGAIDKSVRIGLTRNMDRKLRFYNAAIRM